MEYVETSGVVIAVQKNNSDGRVRSVDIFTEDYGIMRWLLRSKIDVAIDWMFADVEISGDKKTDTFGQANKIELLSDNSKKLLENGSYYHAKRFVEIIREVVFDGIRLDNIFVILKQAIRNFLEGFNAETVLLKGLYLVCKEEGYAVDTDWMNSLPDGDKLVAKNMIATREDLNFLSSGSRIAASISEWILGI